MFIGFYEIRMRHAARKENVYCTKVNADYMLGIHRMNMGLTYLK